MTRVTKGLCLYKNSDPKGLSAPGAIYMYKKTWKIMYKIRLQRYFFETCNKWAKWSGLSVDINICQQEVICPCPGAIYMYKSIKIYTRTRCQVSVTGPLVLWFSYLFIFPFLARLNKEELFYYPRRQHLQKLQFYIKVFRTSLFPKPLMDLVHIWCDDRYGSKILRNTIPTPANDLKVIVTDLEFLC